MRRNLSTPFFGMTTVALSGVLLLTSSFSATAYQPVRLTVPSHLPQATAGKTFSYSFANRVTGGTGPPYIWKVTGALPSGLKLGTSTGKLSGTLSKTAKVSTYSLKVCATGAKRAVSGSVTSNTGCQRTKISVAKAVLTLSPSPTSTIRITTFELPSAIEAHEYRATVEATGGFAPYHCALKIGSTFPDGYALVPDTCITSGRGAILAS